MEWKPLFHREGDDPKQMHQKMAALLDQVIEK